MALTLHLLHPHASAPDRARERRARRVERQQAADRDAAFWDNVDEYLHPRY
jgi:hypothetical protein